MKKGLVGLLAIVSMFSVLSGAHASTSATTSTPASSSSNVIVTPMASKTVTAYYTYPSNVTPPKTINYSDPQGYQGTLNRIGIYSSDGNTITWMYQGTVSQN
ncbi:hypothetical protein P4G83_28785 [Bacillus cereus]|nr:hypothetical protein [Bacillus cereus]